MFASKRGLKIGLFLTCLIGFQISLAQTITLQTPNMPVPGQAFYSLIDADKSKPAVLILHGFSATHNYPTVLTLQDFLNIQGYTTLSPTLTMNIPLRSQPLSCNSLHTHTLEQDISELNAWIDWLKQQGHQRIILVGHSSGSQTILEALAQSKGSDSITGLIFTSLFYLMGEELGNKPEDKIIAQQRLAAGDFTPRNYSFLFCQNDYFATPQSYLSYLSITRQRVLDTLSQLNLPSYTLMGGADSRYSQVGLNWLNELEQTPTQLKQVEGANHFFTGLAEAAFHEQLLAALVSLEHLQ
jgi:pimeloyl-ACP methyl ester carboxylesterase